MFYIYSHLRSDTKEPFYIGKGNGKRAFAIINRNKLWHEIVKDAGGFIVNFLVKNIDEELALLSEREVIDSYRKRGVNLVNLTSGGQGVSGLKHSDETKLKFSKIHKGKIITEEVRKKISNSMKGINVGRPISEQQKCKISATLLGRKIPEATKLKMAEAQKVRRIKESVLLTNRSL